MAPMGEMLTPYDHEHIITNLRLLYADADAPISAGALARTDRSAAVTAWVSSS